MRLLGKLRTSAPEPAFSNVLTPGRIPEFCIPPRLPVPCPPESPPPAASVPRRCAAEPDLWPRADDQGAGRTDWDPRSQAALSLPHLPRVRTAYGFCALLESPHTRRKESLFLGGPGARAPALVPAPRPRAHTYAGAGPGSPGAPLAPRPAPDAAAPDALPAGPRASRDALAPTPRGRRLLRAPDGLLSRALRVRRAHRRARASSVSSGDEHEERGPASPPAAAPSPPPGPPRPERLQAEGTVALGRAGDALRLAAEYCPRRGRLRIRLLRAEGPAAALEPRAVGCRLSLVLRPPGAARQPRSRVLGRSRKAAWDQDCCFDGLSEEQLRRLAVRVQAEDRGRGLQRRRPLGQGELLLGELLLGELLPL